MDVQVLGRLEGAVKPWQEFVFMSLAEAMMGKISQYRKAHLFSC